MRRWWWLAWTLLAAPALAAPPDPAPVVILLSLDGVRHDYPDRQPLPALARITRDGVRAESLVPVFPSSTFPNHVSLATGAPSDVHGIVGNRFLDAELGLFDFANDARFLRAEPIWVAAERQGVRAASFFWVASETDWRGVGATFRRTPFDGGIPESEKVDQILAWLDLPASERPGLVLSWWHGADGAGHRFGPASAESDRQLAGQDAQLARLLEGLDARGAWPHTTLLIVSDHGMTAIEELVDVRALLAEAGVSARVIHGTATAHVHLADPGERDRARAAIEAAPGLRVHPPDAVPEALRYRVADRTGDLVVLVDPPIALRTVRPLGEGWRRVAKLLGGATGGHGYDPALRDMHAVFLAIGRGVPAGVRIGPVHALQVAPTVARLLGIAPPAASEGAPVAEIGAALTPRSAQSAGGPRRSAPSVNSSSGSSTP